MSILGFIARVFVSWLLWVAVMTGAYFLGASQLSHRTNWWISLCVGAVCAILADALCSAREARDRQPR